MTFRSSSQRACLLAFRALILPSLQRPRSPCAAAEFAPVQKLAKLVGRWVCRGHAEGANHFIFVIKSNGKAGKGAQGNSRGCSKGGAELRCRVSGVWCGEPTTFNQTERACNTWPLPHTTICPQYAQATAYDTNGQPKGIPAGFENTTVCCVCTQNVVIASPFSCQTHKSACTWTLGYRVKRAANADALVIETIL